MNDALVVLDNLKDLHKNKNVLRTATRMFNEAMAAKPQVDEDQVDFITKSMMKAFDKYTNCYQTYIQGGNQGLIYNSRYSPEILTDIAKWLDHLVKENIHEGEGGEPLLDTLRITRDEYLESLEKLSTDNRSNVHDNTTSDI